MPTQREQLSTSSTLVVAAIASGLMSAWAYPGYMSHDSIVQYMQAVGVNPLSDLHPPIMALTWRLLIAVFRSPGALLVFDQVIFWTGAALVGCGLYRSTPARMAATLAIGLWPPLLVISLHLWKDAGMLASFMLASGAILYDRKSPHWPLLGLAAAAIVYGAVIRHNSILAALPLLALLTARGLTRWPVAFGKHKASGGALLVALLGLCCVGAGQLLGLGARHKDPLTPTFVWDMAAISVAENVDLIPSYVARLTPGDALPSLSGTFTEDSNWPIFAVVSPDVASDNQWRLYGDWAKLAWQHPGSYLRHRWQVFATLLGLSPNVYAPYNRGIDQNNFGLAFAWPAALAWRNWLFSVAAGTPIYRSWLYLLLGIGIVLLSGASIIARRPVGFLDGAALAFATSGLLTVLPLFVFAPSADFRFAVWMIGGSMLGTMCWIAARREKIPLSLDVGSRRLFEPGSGMPTISD